MRNDSGTKPVVEMNFAVRDLIVEVCVFPLTVQFAFDMRQCEIMRRDHTDAAEFNEFAHDGSGANLPVVRVGSAEKFVQKKECSFGSPCQIYNLLDPHDLRVKAGSIVE